MSRPTLGLAMIARDAEATIEACLQSVRGLVGHWTISDTGSSDLTKARIHAELDAIPGRLVDDDWIDYGTNRTLMLEQARGTADWLLLIDCDMTADFHPGLESWLASDPDPGVDAWMVEIKNHGIHYRLPWLIRGDREWKFRGAVHEHLDLEGCTDRQLLGLTLTHHGDGRGDRLEHDLELLRKGFDVGDARDTFYFAETLRFLGRDQEAIAAYRRRFDLGGWDEEVWYSAYQAAKLARKVDGLIAAHRLRPWRHEPLTAAAQIIAEAGAREDILFVEQPGSR